MKDPIGDILRERLVPTCNHVKFKILYTDDGFVQHISPITIICPMCARATYVGVLVEFAITSPEITEGETWDFKFLILQEER